MTQLAGRVIETALGAELSEHLGYSPGQAPPGGAGNARNGWTPKRVIAPVPVIDDPDQVEMIVATLREAGALEAAVVPEVDAVHPAGADA